MNIYEVDAGVQNGWQDCGDGEGLRDMPVIAQTHCYIGAQSRSRAWVEFRAYWRTEGINLDFLDKKRIRLIYGDVDCPAGVDGAGEWLERHGYKMRMEMQS